ncbi:Sugar transferase involved in LPS biosynthesis (colanic, teichoic acid) [Salinihabitans flavidus]|uniref:Sugar transferase involved in LPS biosynthesis (Colanic, teichoic acid) n=1 Tax=Salinihabitans flavidus TaxID=569882 RepID=A0A1H8QTL9_9RHOB|nr:sugar transferase [Salinihabitans flavidus]SEO57183.1 Sugar transferase involved in LPS biosynthesis (colanic, teichoic acid) [Salinihabitans flavidus]
MTLQSRNEFAEAFVIETPRFGFYRDHFKRQLDILVCLMLAPLVLPIVLVLALIIARDGASPFYWQERIGRNGRVFHMLKLRSMVPDADQMLERYLDENLFARREWDEMQKLRIDPRITPIGRLLRTTSLDELPQLWNVLWGQMSLVGPRPMMCSQKELYPGNAYFSMRPGITGYWQISERNETSFAQRAIYDTRYYRELSLNADLRVLVRTVGVVLAANGQ